MNWNKKNKLSVLGGFCIVLSLTAAPLVFALNLSCLKKETDPLKNLPPGPCPNTEIWLSKQQYDAGFCQSCAIQPTAKVKQQYYFSEMNNLIDPNGLTKKIILGKYASDGIFYPPTCFSDLEKANTQTSLADYYARTLLCNNSNGVVKGGVRFESAGEKEIRDAALAHLKENLYTGVLNKGLFSEEGMKKAMLLYGNSQQCLKGVISRFKPVSGALQIPQDLIDQKKFAQSKGEQFLNSKIAKGNTFSIADLDADNKDKLTQFMAEKGLFCSNEVSAIKSKYSEVGSVHSEIHLKIKNAYQDNSYEVNEAVINKAIADSVVGRDPSQYGAITQIEIRSTSNLKRNCANDSENCKIPPWDFVGLSQHRSESMKAYFTDKSAIKGELNPSKITITNDIVPVSGPCPYVLDGAKEGKSKTGIQVQTVKYIADKLSESEKAGLEDAKTTEIVIHTKDVSAKLKEGDEHVDFSLTNCMKIETKCKN